MSSKELTDFKEELDFCLSLSISFINLEFESFAETKFCINDKKIAFTLFSNEDFKPNNKSKFVNSIMKFFQGYKLESVRI